jgi:hypothetical protein
MRIAVVRDVLRADFPRASERASAGAPESTWLTNLELLKSAAPHARRVEAVPVTPRFDVRQRASRYEARAAAWDLAKAAWAARGRRTPPPAPPSPQPATS